jgi:hypothetical protein
MQFIIITDAEAAGKLEASGFFAIKEQFNKNQKAWKFLMTDELMKALSEQYTEVPMAETSVLTF